MGGRGWESPLQRLSDVFPEPVSGWILAQADQLLRRPLSHLDPERRARGIDERLDGVRARLADLAASGRIPRGERTHLLRELSALDADLTRLEARLPPVRALTLRARLAAYTRAVDGLPLHRPGTRPGRAGEAAALAGTAAVGWAALETAPALGLAGGAGLLAAGCGAAVLTAASWARRRGRRGLLDEALDACDGALPRLSGHLVSDLDRQYRETLRHARASGRLGPEAARLLGLIGEHLDALLVRALVEGLDPDVEHLVRASVTDYLPDTLDPFLALPDPGARVAGRSAADEVADQLRGVERALRAALERPSRNEPATRLLVQGDFLRSKFGTS